MINRSHLLNKVGTVLIGTIALKAAMFFLNSGFARSAEAETASMLAKTIAFGFAWSSVIHFSSSRYIARAITQGRLAVARFSLNLALMLIPLTLTILALFKTFQTGDEENGISILLALVFTGALACFDLSTGVAGAIGNNKIAAIGQGLLGAVIGACAAGLAVNSIDSLIIIPAALTIAALAISLFILYLISKGIPNNLDTKNSQIKKHRQARDMFFFTLPSVIGTLFMNPVILLSADTLAKTSSTDFLVFLICQNIFGMAMLLPGQINTATFSFLVRDVKKRTTQRSAVLLTVFAALISVIVAMLAVPLLQPLYGPLYEKVAESAIWFALAAIPSSISQAISTRLFIAGNPWADARANFVFAAFFAAGCFVCTLAEECSVSNLGRIFFSVHILKMLLMLLAERFFRKS